MPDNTDDIPRVARDWFKAGRGAALATVVQTWGSAPCPVGSLMAISGDGGIAGSVSGGCVEGAVIVAAEDAIETGLSRILTFGVSDDQAFAVGLACGGEITVMVEPLGTGIPVAEIDALIASRGMRKPVAMITDTRTWTHRLEYRDQGHDARFKADASGFDPDGTTFVAVNNPPPRLAIVGAGHIAQPLSKMAVIAGWDVTVIDPRGAFATPDRFPGTALSLEWPDAALAEMGMDRRTAVVTLAHDPKIDDPAIIAALSGGAGYLGCLGSRRTHEKRLERLNKGGLSAELLSRIHGPVGLAISSRTPAEIAISILAELTKEMRTP